MFLYKILTLFFITAIQASIITESEAIIKNPDVSFKRDYLINEVFIHKNYNQELLLTSKNDTILTSNEIPLGGEEGEVPTEKSKTFIDYYNDGVQAYLSNDWDSCINHMERAIFLYHEYYEAITTCRIRCENERQRYNPRHLDNYDDRHFYEGLIFKTLCLERCRKESLPHMPKYFMLFTSDKKIFKERKPYEYLQICYYRDKEIEKAISAAYTVVVANPHDEIMKKNIKFYSDLQEFDFDKLKDFEDKAFSGFYQDAVDKYQKEQWKQSIELFETTIDVWVQEFEKCRVFCDGEYNQGWLPDLTTTVANHYAHSLRCRQNCTIELAYVNGRYHEDILPSIYDHLQYAYYKVDNIKEACQCVASYLLFYPNSEIMLTNLEFYKTLPNVTDDYFQPRSEAISVFSKNFYEEDLLHYFDEEFTKLLEEYVNENNDITSFKLPMAGKELLVQNNLNGQQPTTLVNSVAESVNVEKKDTNKIPENWKEVAESF